MLKHILPAVFLVLQSFVSLGQDSSKLRYTVGDSLLSDSVEKIFSQKFDYNEVLLEKKFSIKKGNKDSKDTLKFSYQKRHQNAEVLEVVLVKEKERYVETYFIDNKVPVVCIMMMLTDSTGKMEQPWVSRFYFLDGKPVYGWSVGTPIDESMGEQILMLYAARRKELEKRL